MNSDTLFNMPKEDSGEQTSVDQYEFEPIQGYPMLNWKGKRPFRSTQYYPAQLKEMHGEEVNGWRNKIYWGDNLQVMSYLLKEYRGRIKLIYIDPPFDSKADYRKKIRLRGQTLEKDYNTFEEKQYSDIWTNDEYLQFMYERLILMRELLSDDGILYLHCDHRRGHHLRCLLDEVFGMEKFVNEIIWKHQIMGGSHDKRFPKAHETILWYTKGSSYRLRSEDPNVRVPFSDYVLDSMKQDEQGRWYYERRRMSRKATPEEAASKAHTRTYVDDPEAGTVASDVWSDMLSYQELPQERQGLDLYPTQKTVKLLTRLISAGSDLGDLVFDCFMGSGTTQVAAMKLGRRFIGADINLGAIRDTTLRLLGIAEDIERQASHTLSGLGIGELDKYEANGKIYTGFEVYNVNQYDIFRNPVEAKDLLIEALEIQPLQRSGLYDGEKDGRMVKIMPINRIATKADLNELITGFNYRDFERRQQEHPNQPVERLLLVCMGHDPDLAATLQKGVSFSLDIEVVDILRDKSNLEFKRDSEAKIIIDNSTLIVERFYPMNLLQKLSLMKENIEDWRELVESVMIDWNYDGAVLSPAVTDIPPKDEFVSGTYSIPEDAGTIRVKITDLLSESLEVEVENG